MAARLDLNLMSGDAAFEPDTARAELVTILRNMAQQIEDGAEGAFRFHDTNGNACGGAFLEIWDDEASA